MRVREQWSVEEGDTKVHTCGQSAVNRAASRLLFSRGWRGGRPWSWADLRVTGDRSLSWLLALPSGCLEGAAPGHSTQHRALQGACLSAPLPGALSLKKDSQAAGKLMGGVGATQAQAGPCGAHGGGEACHRRWGRLGFSSLLILDASAQQVELTARAAQLSGSRARRARCQAPGLEPPPWTHHQRPGGLPRLICENSQTPPSLF